MIAPGPALVPFALQRALYARLTAHAATSGYTWTESGDPALPFGRLGPQLAEGWDTFSTAGARVVYQIDTFARDTPTAAAMLTALDAALRSAPLDLGAVAPGYRVAGVPRLTLSTTLRETDAQTGDPVAHGVASYAFLVTTT